MTAAPLAMPHTRAALSRLAAAWRALRVAQAEARALDRRCRASVLLARALRLDPDVCDQMIEQTVQQTVDKLRDRGMIFTRNELAWMALQAGALDRETATLRPGGGGLTAVGLLALQDKLKRAMAATR